MIKKCTVGLLLSFAWGFHSPRATASETTKPNILVILADDQRADTVGAVNPHIQTPNMDRLAKRGVLFNNCYGIGAHSPAVCLPSRIMIMSGCSLFNLPGNAHKWPLTTNDKPEVPVMSTVFNAAGYDTFYSGKRGNTYYSANMTFTKRYIADIRGGISENNQSAVDFRRKYATEVVKYLRAPERKEKPFFVFYAPPVPHDPLYMEPDCQKLYTGDKRPPLPPSAEIDHAALTGFHQRDTYVRPFDVPGVGRFLPPLDLEKWRDILGLYYGMVSSFDRDVGRILDALDQSGAATNTIIVFSSDNGLAMTDHGLIHKSSLYEHDIKLPLIVCGPGIPENRRSDAFVYVSDLFPTLCQLAGVPIPLTVQTHSFLPAVRHPGAPHRENLYFAYREEMRAFRDDRYKVILYDNRYAQLYDLKADPLEAKDLARDPAYSDVLTELIDQARKVGDAMGDSAGKTIANQYRRWPKTACRLPEDGDMLWEIWSASARPGERPVPGEGIKASASSRIVPDKSPEVLLHGAGLNRAGRHDNDGHGATMWVSARTPAASSPADGLPAYPAWLRFDFAEPQRLASVLVWNHNQAKLTNRGFRETVAYGSTDGGSWFELGAFTLKEAGGGAEAAQAFALTTGGKALTSVIIAAKSNYGSDFYGLSEIQFTAPIGANNTTP